ncbi:hypothetical protein SprV_0501738100 [Sparganum proliferum]
MEAGDVVSATFQRLLHGRKFTSFDALEDAISRFTEETGYQFKPVNSHKLPAGSPNAEKFVFYSRKYVCVLASTRHRTGCGAFFNIQYRREGCLAVTSSNVIHGHEPAPGAPRPSKQKSPGSRLTDYRALRQTSPTAKDQTRRLCAIFKNIFQSGVYDNYDDLMSAVREYEKFMESKSVDTSRLDAEEYCRRRHYKGLRPRVRRICQMLTGYASDVMLDHLLENSNVELSSDAADTCSCQFHRNWQLPCVHIVNYLEQHRVDPCQALSKSRWVFRVDVCEQDVADENVDPGVVTSFPADVLVSKVRRPLTEAYKYKVAMSHLQPIVEKLKSCGSQRFEELLREVDAFADRIMNAPSGWQQESLVDSPSQPNGDEMEVDASDEVVRCQIREEGNVFVAQWGSDQDPSVRILHNDTLLPNFRIRGRPCTRRPWTTRKPLRSRAMNVTVSTHSASSSLTRRDSRMPSRHLDETAVDMDDIPEPPFKVSRSSDMQFLQLKTAIKKGMKAGRQAANRNADHPKQEAFSYSSESRDTLLQASLITDTSEMTSMMRQSRDSQRESLALSDPKPGKSVANNFRHLSSSKLGHELPPLLTDNQNLPNR